MTFLSYYAMGTSQHHMTLMASLMAPLHFLCKVYKHQVQQNFFGHVMPLAPVSALCDHNACMLYECIHLGMYIDRNT